jgi:NADPH:quinone reductase-like Zn-dependent oxidoreductase
MKAVTEDVRTGRIEVTEVPEPEVRPGGILVQTAFSAISPGTERAKIETGEKSLVGKALARPDLVKQVLDLARDQGIAAAYQKVKGRLDSLSPLGYSSAGTVIAVGEGVKDFRVGERVACAGAGYANHAEVNFIPSNLAVHIPSGVSLDSAAFSTIGSIAMQGLRQADV